MLAKCRGKSACDLFAVEVFSGTSRLTAAIRHLGFRDSFGIDHQISSRLTAPVVQLDLTIQSNYNYLLSIIAEPGCIYVHFAPPCGTASRARLIKRKNRYNPPPLRSELHPDGLPNLSAHHQVRVSAANHLYDVTQALCRHCVTNGVLFSIENPAQSFMWLTTAMKSFLEEFQLHHTFLHHCMYGSSRRKHTKLVHNIDALSGIGVLCDDSHDHEPWGVTSQGWATAEETAYPWPLCRRMATLVALQIQQYGVACETPPCARQASQLDSMRQQTDHQLTTKGLPWVSEFQRIEYMPADTPLPPNAKLIATPPVGYIASGNQKTVGILRSPEEFVQEALSNGHPGIGADRLPAP